jgi:hypothetical protein
MHDPGSSNEMGYFSSDDERDEERNGAEQWLTTLNTYFKHVNVRLNRLEVQSTTAQEKLVVLITNLVRHCEDESTLGGDLSISGFYYVFHHYCQECERLLEQMGLWLTITCQLLEGEKEFNYEELLKLIDQSQGAVFLATV